jgi:aminopeptidase N
MSLAQTLAIRLPDESAAIVAHQLANTQNPDRHRRLTFLAPSLAAEEDVRNAFFVSLAKVENRHTESWVAEALSNLHHPSRVASSEHYLLPTLELLQEIQRTGDISFPTDWLHESLGNHHSATAVATVRAFLEQRPDYNAQLRMKILQAADPMFRANRIRNAQQDLTAGQ